MKADEQVSTTSIRLKVLPNGTIQGSSHTQATGDSEISLRDWRFNNQAMPPDQVATKILDDFNLTGIGTIHTSDPNDLNAPFEIDTSFTLDPVSNFPGPAAMPIPVGLAVEVIEGKMLPKPKSKINFQKKCESFTYINQIEMEFPPSLKIKNIPENVSYSDDTGYYTASYMLQGNKLKVSRKIVSQHPSLVCGEHENELDKAFFPIFARDMRAQVIYE